MRLGHSTSIGRGRHLNHAPNAGDSIGDFVLRQQRPLSLPVIVNIHAIAFITFFTGIRRPHHCRLPLSSRRLIGIHRRKPFYFLKVQKVKFLPQESEIYSKK